MAEQKLGKQELLQVLKAYAASSGSDVVVFASSGELLLSTVEDPACREDLAARLVTYLDSDAARTGARVMLQRGQRLYSVRPAKVGTDKGPLYVFTIQGRRPQAVRAGIEYLDAGQARLELETDPFCIAGGSVELSPLVSAAYAHGVPVMFEGEAGSGKAASAVALYAQGSWSHQPLVRISCDLLNERNWNHLVSSSSSPLYQNDMTLFLNGLHALSSKRYRELATALRDSAAADRCHVLLAGNDIPGGGECDAVALCAERLNCAVCVTPPLRERPDIHACIERYLAYLSDIFEMRTPTLEDEATKLLASYSWPRNYMQLREVSERLFVLAADTHAVTARIAQDVLAQENVIRSAVFSTPTFDTDLYVLRPLADIECDIARIVVEHMGGNKTRAAEVLGISRTTLWRMLG